MLEELISYYHIHTEHNRRKKPVPAQVLLAAETGISVSYLQVSVAC
jgi:hypothetical protein